MRILHLTTFLQGGAGLAIVALARSQRAAGHEVTVVTSKSAPEGYGNYGAHLEALVSAGVPVHLVDSLFYRDRTLNAQAVRYLRSHLNDRTVDLIHAHAGVPARIALRLAWRCKATVIQTMHGWGVRKTVRQSRSDVAVLKRVARAIVPSQASLSLLEGLGVPADRMTIVPYGVDPVNDPLAGIDSPDPDLKHIRHVRQSGRRVACCLGTLGERKNQQLLIEALALIPAASRPYCLFVGEGDVAAAADLARRLNVDDSVRFAGHKANARELLQASDCLVLPSRSEGLPVAVLEAFCDRVPVIASDIPELTELVQHEVNGLLFAAGDANALAAAVNRLFSMPHPDRWAMCCRAHERHIHEFRTRQMCDRYMRAYEQVLAARAARSTETTCAA